MTNYSPEVDEQLNTLAKLCCDSLGGDFSGLEERGTPLLKALLLGGFARKSGPPLQAELEKRILDQCREPAMHRGGEVSGLARELQKKFDELVRWESKTPADEGPPQAANVDTASSATHRRRRTSD